MSLPGLSALPVMVFVAETCVVTLCTVRTIFLTRGWRGLAAFLGFFEVSIWLFAIGQVMSNLSRLECSLAFAGGFSLGNFLGVTLEQRLALGHVVVQVTTRSDPAHLIASLRSGGYGVTSVGANGATGPVQVIYSVVPRRQRAHVLALVRDFDRQAFYAVHDLQATAAGVFPSLRSRPRLALAAAFWQRLAAAQMPDPLKSGPSDGPAPDPRESTAADVMCGRAA